MDLMDSTTSRHAHDTLLRAGASARTVNNDEIDYSYFHSSEDRGAATRKSACRQPLAAI